mmetsp:Transcript_89292/g.255706  ORF Transcript_89292/g.255706 Transcript_89292/m.255706 type:complete len:202 (-) Transcript_89292:278-883(-)
MSCSVHVLLQPPGHPSGPCHWQQYIRRDTTIESEHARAGGSSMMVERSGQFFCSDGRRSRYRCRQVNLWLSTAGHNRNTRNFTHRRASKRVCERGLRGRTACCQRWLLKRRRISNRNDVHQVVEAGIGSRAQHVVLKCRGTDELFVRALRTRSSPEVCRNRPAGRLKTFGIFQASESWRSPGRSTCRLGAVIRGEHRADRP